MPTVCIDRSVLGEPFDLCVDLGRFKWCDGPPATAWTLGCANSILSLDEFSTLVGKPIRSIPERFKKSFEAVGHTAPIRWRHALPKKEFKAYFDGMMGDIQMLLNEGYITYYTDVFCRARECLRALGHACVDKDMLELFIAQERNPTNVSTLKSFIPGVDGFAKKVEYNQLSTVTGRLIVNSGPRILVLPKKYRNIIISRYKEGRVVTLDYKSLEPRLILETQGLHGKDDIYADICERYLNGIATRKQAKIVTIMLLYGAGRAAMSKASGLVGPLLDSVIANVTTYFQLRELEKKLLDEVRAFGMIKNFYGRPVQVNDRKNVVNLYAQSSAVDAVMLGFSNAITLIKDKKYDIVPTFIIHDMLVLDVEPSMIKYIPEIEERCTHVLGIEGKLPIKCEEIV